MRQALGKQMGFASIWLQIGGGSAITGLLPFILIFVIFYFLLFLPSQRRQKQQQQMLANLKTGDRVVTTGGIRGTIVSLKDDCLHLRVPPQDIRLEIARNAVAGLLGEEGKKSA
jgi:preprotein translocase subunit YajC